MQNSVIPAHYFGHCTQNQRPNTDFFDLRTENIGLCTQNIESCNKFLAILRENQAFLRNFLTSVPKIRDPIPTFSVSVLKISAYSLSILSPAG